MRPRQRGMKSSSRQKSSSPAVQFGQPRGSAGTQTKAGDLKPSRKTHQPEGAKTQGAENAWGKPFKLAEVAVDGNCGGIYVLGVEGDSPILCGECQSFFFYCFEKSQVLP